jgi:hypothetical protein
MGLLPASTGLIFVPRIIFNTQFHFPFTFKIPVGVPSSVSFNPGSLNPTGVFYEVSKKLPANFFFFWHSFVLKFLWGRFVQVSAFQSSLNEAPVSTSGNFADVVSRRSSRAVLKFRRSSYFPILRDIKPTATKEKHFLGSSKAVTLTASLDREVYQAGAPVIIKVFIRNESGHDINAIRISAKQVVDIKTGSGERENYKCQVALLESNQGCPIRKGQSLTQNFTIIPEILRSESYHVAQASDPTTLLFSSSQQTYLHRAIF